MYAQTTLWGMICGFLSRRDVPRSDHYAESTRAGYSVWGDTRDDIQPNVETPRVFSNSRTRRFKQLSSLDLSLIEIVFGLSLGTVFLGHPWVLTGHPPPPLGVYLGVFLPTQTAPVSDCPRSFSSGSCPRRGMPRRV